MFSLCALVETLSTDQKKKKQQHTGFSTHSRQQYTEEALEGGKPWLVPGCDLLSTPLQLNYSRQLDWSLPLQTTLLAADLLPASNPATHTHTHTTEIFKSQLE